MTMSSALLTDHYELTMLEAALRSGAAHRRAVFEVFARHLPGGRRYGVVAGTGRVLDELENFRFTDDDITFLRDNHVVDEPTLAFLADYKFSGNIYGYREGDLYFPASPIMIVEGTFAEAVLLETLTLSILNHDCAIASAASRMVNAAGQRPIIEMGSRRTHERAAVAAARAAYIAGFAVHLQPHGRTRYGLPHRRYGRARVHPPARHRAPGVRGPDRRPRPGTTLLVDTYDVLEAVRTAVELAGPELGAVRIDSGDLAVAAQEVREQLDALGAFNTRILVTSDLDEYAIAALAAAPVDGYGVGTALVTGSGVPTAALVYKLVARETPIGKLEPVAKRSVGKPSRGGRKRAYRVLDDSGHFQTELVSTSGLTPKGGVPLLHQLVRDGVAVGREPLSEARARHAEAMTHLPKDARHLARGYAAIPTEFA